MFPYLDLSTFKRRTAMSGSEVDYVETDSPGFTATRIAVRSSYINGRLRKRYGNAGNANSLPFGQTAPLLVPSGISPPGVTLKGRPTLGAYLMLVEVTTGGVRGVAVIRWSSNGGVTYTTGVTTAETIAFGTTGLTGTFAEGTYTVGDLYAAAPPVPEVILGWLTTFVTYDLYRRRGVNPQDPQIELLKEEVDTAMAELKEAADSKDGLFDLPVSEDEDSAVTTGGPLGYSETSPYVWTDVEASVGRAQDAQAAAFTGSENFGSDE